MRNYAILASLLLIMTIGVAGNSPVRTHSDGVLAPRDPLQQKVIDKKPWKKNGYLIRPLATFRIDARVLLTDHYRWDRESELAPVDLTLGWGPLSDSSVLGFLELSHGYRHYRWRSKELPLPPDQINSHMANMHIIPADAYQEGKLKKIVVGDIVTIDGFLIEAAKPDGWSWHSSLSREDSGNGACEVVWADRITVR